MLILSSFRIISRVFLALIFIPLGLTTVRADRVTNGLIALYNFEEGNGDIIHDVSGVEPPLELINNTPSATSWIPGALAINNPTILASSGPATKIFNACQSSDEISLEAWVNPFNTTQEGPARIITCSDGASYRNFMLCSDLTRYGFRLRTTDPGNSDNGWPTMETPDGYVTTDLTHLVCTRDSSGNVVIYVDSVSQSTAVRAGNFSNWDSSYRLALALEFDVLPDSRYWLGEMHLVAVYSRALSPAEVAQNYAANANPTPTATITPSRTRTPTPTPVFTSTSTHTLTSTRTLTPTPTPREILKPDQDILAYPVPATGGRIYFSYRLGAGASVTNEIYNLLGEKVITLRKEHAAVSQGQMIWDIQDVAPGVYLYRLRIQYHNGETKTFPVKKIIIVKLR